MKGGIYRIKEHTGARFVWSLYRTLGQAWHPKTRNGRYIITKGKRMTDQQHKRMIAQRRAP